MIKRNELSRCEKTQRKLKYVLLSKRSQSEKTIHCIIQTGRDKTIDTIKGSEVARG